MNNTTTFIPTTQLGAIDMKTLFHRYFTGYWENILSQLSLINKEVYTSANRRVYKGYFEENADRIIDALRYWISSSEDNSLSASQERSLNDFLSSYLYAGDYSLSKYKNKEDGIPFGLSVVLVNAIFHKKDLRKLFFCYIKAYPDDSVSEKEKRYLFAHVILENVRLMLVDMWNDELFSVKLKDDSLRYELIKTIESCFMDYGKFTAPVRKLRIIKMLNIQSSLPDISGIKERYHLLSSLIENHLDIRGKDNIDLLINKVLPFWEKHIEVENLEKEADAERINALIKDILESITSGELKSAENMRNKESGAEGRSLKADFKKYDELLKSENLGLTEYKFILEEKSRIALRLKMLNGTTLSIEEESVGEVKIDPVYCPDDHSDIIWQELSTDYKLFLLSNELSLSLDSKAGYKGVLQKYINTPVSYIPLNIVRLILERILGISIDVVNASNKKIMRDKIVSLCEKESCTLDLTYTLRKLIDTKVNSIIECAESPTEISLLNKAYSIIEELKKKD